MDVTITKIVCSVRNQLSEISSKKTGTARFLLKCSSLNENDNF